ncbi:hypothetical protein SK128_015450 [Halocaridina rubra]|uniref:Uncharacterized protein n=1 Tax=Halocaridina rubra TaxID=373956 RepID=A0AAN8XVP1_HALRR
MRRKATWIFSCLLVLIILLVKKTQATSKSDPKDDMSLSPAEWQELEEEDMRGKRVFAYYTSTSVTRLITTTITAISTCLSTVATPSCTGRKRRSPSKISMNVDKSFADKPELEASVDTIEDLEDGYPRSPDEVSRQGRRLTIWSTAYTTVTVTSTSALAGTTVTASLLCAVAGLGASCYLG